MNNPTPQICLAPMRGLTGAIFRNTYAEFFSGIDWAVTPFLTTVQGTHIKPALLNEVLPRNNTRMPIVPQIISKTATKFIALSKSLHDIGHDTVNWNLGCPFARVAKKRRGSGLLPYPELIDAFLNTVLASIPNQLSIKVRLGRHDPEEIFALLPVFNRYPIKELIIHPRTGVQMYSGKPDVEAFARCLPQCRCPVIYNGDITSRENFEALQKRFPAIDTWMIGRGVLGDPFLPEAIKGVGHAHTDRVRRFRQFHDALFERYALVRQGPVQLANSMKGYWSYFACGFKQGERILRKIRKAQHAAQYTAVVTQFFETEAQWRDDSAARGASGAETEQPRTCWESHRDDQPHECV
jgi:tRNA-dihydrouridine synthase B